MNRRQPPLALCLALVASLAAPVAVAQQTRCDCAENDCHPMEPSVVTLTGQITPGSGADASGHVEHFLTLSVRRAVCVEVVDGETGARRTATTAQRLQLIVTDAALARRLRRMQGLSVTLRGVLVAQITAHHHTPLLLDVRGIGRAGGDAGPSTRTSAPRRP